MSSETRNRLALALLLLAKIVGVAGLIVGATSYRVLGGTLLAVDAVLLASGLALALLGMRDQRREEKAHVDVLAQMVREGTLDQFLRDVREREAQQAERAAAPPTASRSARTLELTARRAL